MVGVVKKRKSPEKNEKLIRVDSVFKEVDDYIMHSIVTAEKKSPH